MSKTPTWDHIRSGKGKAQPPPDIAISIAMCEILSLIAERLPSKADLIALVSPPEVLPCPYCKEGIPRFTVKREPGKLSMTKASCSNCTALVVEGSSVLDVLWGWNRLVVDAVAEMQAGEKPPPQLFSAEDMEALRDRRTVQVKLLMESWPPRIRLPSRVRSGIPFEPASAAAGTYQPVSNPHGALSVQANNGELLGVKPDEFEWICPHGAPGDTVHVDGVGDVVITSIGVVHGANPQWMVEFKKVEP